MNIRHVTILLHYAPSSRAVGQECTLLRNGCWRANKQIKHHPAACNPAACKGTANEYFGDHALRHTAPVKCMTIT